MRCAFALLLTALILLSACTTSTPTPAATLTLSLTLTPAPSRTPIPTETNIPTLPPSWTPAATPTPRPPTATFTPTFTPTIDPNAALLAQPTRPECAGFSIDFARSSPSFVIGTDPTVYWTLAQNALTYRLTLRDEQDHLLFSITTGGTSFTFDGRLFERNRNYTWDVRPLNVSGEQMCVSRGARLTPVIG
jgi:hypothetical protein